MPNFNKVLLMGNLTRDPELKYFDGSDNCVGNFGVATNRKWKNRTTDQWEEEVTFVDIEVWGRQAETVNEYLTKGSPVFIEGRLKLDQWEDRESGKTRSKLKVVAERVQFLRGSDDDSGPHDHRGGGQSRGRQQSRGGGRRDEGHQGRDDRNDGRDAPRGGGGGNYDFDDIPF